MNALAEIARDHRESSDAYRGVIHLNAEWRIADCKDQIQWLIQRRTRAQSLDGARWVSHSYCQTRKALIRNWASLISDDGTLLFTLLPEYIGLR